MYIWTLQRPWAHGPGWAHGTAVGRRRRRSAGNGGRQAASLADVFGTRPELSSQLAARSQIFVSAAGLVGARRAAGRGAERGDWQGQGRGARRRTRKGLTSSSEAASQLSWAEWDGSM